MPREKGAMGELVVATALRLVEAEGEEGLGFNRVARELGVKPPSLYNHVDSGADLRRRVAIRGWARFADEAEAALGRRREPAAALRALATAYREFARAHPGLFAVLDATTLDPEDAEFAPVQARVLALFEAPLAELGVTPTRRLHAIRALRSALHGFVSLERRGQFRLGPSIETSFRELVDIVVAGIEAR